MTNEDQFIHDILASGIEEPSATFTKNVMNQLAQEHVLQQRRVEIPSLAVVMAILFPLLALLVSLEPVYAQVHVMLKVFKLDSIITQQSVIAVSGAILLLCLLDIALVKWFVNAETSSSEKPLKPLSL